MTDDVRTFYNDIDHRKIFDITVTKDGDETTARCPFHEDVNPSLSINFLTGLWKCWGCEARGNSIQWVMQRRDINFKDALKAIADEQGLTLPTGMEPINEGLIDKWHHTLLDSAVPIYKWLTSEGDEDGRGLTKEILQQYKLGYDGGRITIPIYDELGCLVNVRKYKRRAKGKDKMISFKRGYGTARLYPLQTLEKDEIVLVEGEMDMLTSKCVGLNAMTVTSGAGVWKFEWNRLFTGKTVYICYDVDDKGRDGAYRVALSLYKSAKAVYIVNLPLKSPAGADITNYFVNDGYTLDDFEQLMKATELFEVHEKPAAERDEKVYQIHLSQASHKNYYYKQVEIDAMVCGKDLAPFFVPRRIVFNCQMIHRSLCTICGLGEASGRDHEVVIDHHDVQLLSMLRATDKQVKGILKNIGKVLCPQHQMEIKEVMNVEEVRIIPELNYSSEETEYVLRQSFYVGHGLHANTGYIFKGVCVPEPNSQYAVTIMNTAQPSRDDISTFDDEGARDLLKIFQPAKQDYQGIIDKLEDVHTNLERCITNIYDRHELIMALDLVYHSVLSFIFNGVRLRRGWVEGLVLGDTRCGKTETARRYIDYTRLGELITGENTSFAGLVGGLQQFNKRWSITWGKIPLNDRRLVIIDEASALSEDDIAGLSGIRSDGVAEITKIQTEKTHARTRKLWMSNPRSTRPLSTYNSGVEAVSELIGRPEDIARFDFAIAVASGEVDMAIINRLVGDLDEADYKLRYSSKAAQALILWAWSRQPDQVVFTDEATRAILEQATDMGNTYSSRIPLVEAAEQRVKLARLSVAIAARTYSTQDGIILIVTLDHVLVVCSWLSKQYSKPSLSYDQYSRARRAEDSLRNEEAVRTDLRTIARHISGSELEADVDAAYVEIIEQLLNYSILRQSDLEDITALEKKEVKQLTSRLIRERFLRKPHTFYVKTPAGIQFLRGEKDRLGDLPPSSSPGITVQEQNLF